MDRVCHSKGFAAEKRFSIICTDEAAEIAVPAANIVKYRPVLRIVDKLRTVTSDGLDLCFKVL